MAQEEQETQPRSPAPADQTKLLEAAPDEMRGVPVTYSLGQKVLHPHRDRLFELAVELRDEDGFNMLVDTTAVDYASHPGRVELPPEVEPERFEVVVGLLSLATGERLRLRVQVPEDDPVVPSLFDVHPGSEALEREVFDMFGIRFDGHPDLTRILMPEDWIGFPLRKDYAQGKIPVQFKGVSNVR
jgi:NADH-quinone oxidoreductase subunit C